MPQLRLYQQSDADFLARLDTGACFNEQRTGKTPTILEVIKQKNAKKVLIICPASAIPAWVEEYKTWLQKPCIGIIGTKQQKEKAIADWKHGLVINYDSFKSTQVRDGLIDKILQTPPDIVILDEAHRIKDPSSANAKACFRLLKIPYRFVLTGTPAPNKPEEIWSLLHFIRPDLFRSYWNFINDYCNTIVITLRNGRSFRDIRGLKPQMQTQLQLMLSTFSTQRKRKDVMTWLPEKDRQVIKLEPTPEQTKYLEELSSYFETEGVVTQGVLDRLIRYRQICLAPRILGLRGKSPKVEWIKDFITDYPDKPFIVFSKFTTFLKLLSTELNLTDNLIIGETPIPIRAERVKAFQKGQTNILLINIDAGKEALTLDRAEAVIFTDKFPPVGDIEQAEDRFVATTKDRANKPHTVYDLVMKGTYDEEILKLIAKRKSSTDVINDYRRYINGPKIQTGGSTTTKM